MIPNFLFFLLLFFRLTKNICCIDYDEVQIEDAYETRSRILMVDGNVWLHAGKDKNITFKTFGNGKIYVDDTDVSKLPDVAAMKQYVGRVDNTWQMFMSLKSRQEAQTSAMRVVLQSAKHYLVALRNITAEITALKKWRADKINRDMRRRGLLVKMTRQIIKINKLIAMNGCEPNKCNNGGTCIPRFGLQFICLCPPHFTGLNCEADVDECSVYNGTIAGCQNNGTCINKQGGFECQCQSGYHGPLCQYHMSACSKTFELCGPHGHCIESIIDPTSAASGDVAAYKCICDWGFKLSSDKTNPTCVDVNECESNPCHPGVDCINLPGSFVCSGCPDGYKIDGNACVDVNECEGEVRVCSPLVKCHNTVGTYYCDSCPAGYSGDGRNCIKEDSCSNNKCHKLATCKTTDDSYNSVGDYTCYCPDGYVGDGIGEEGCAQTTSTVCQNHKCVNAGKCKPTSAIEYQCECETGFLGKFCEKTSPCQTNPCKNGGTCIPVENLAYCDCPKHFFGRACEEEEEHCGAHFTHSTGNYTFELKASNKTSICDFVFTIPAANSAIKINFTTFDRFTQEEPGPTDCATTEANLTLYDGPSDSAPKFATFCGDSHSVYAPLSDTPITLTSTGAMMRFRGTQGVFSISWETVERKCGYRTSKPEGILSVPPNHQDIICEWFISAPGGKVIEVLVPPIFMHSKDAEKCEQNSLEIYDGYSTYDRHRILEACSSTADSQTLRSTGPFLSISFISNMLQSVSGLETIRGFAITYKFVTPDRECGGEYDNDSNEFSFSGVIESPNYGSLYPPNMDCTWKINGTLGNGSYSGDMVLKLTFDSFDVKSGFSANGPGIHYRSFRRLNPLNGNFGIAVGGIARAYTRNIFDSGTCTNDFLKIHDGDGTQIQETCNPRRPPNSLIVNNPVAVLRFHSDSSEQGKGFRIQYEMLCQKRVSGNGTIQTWNFPNGGAAGKCTYIIEAPRTHVIHIRFLTIGLRVLRMSECFYTPEPVETYENYIEFSGGRSDNSFFNRRYVCARYPFVEGASLSVSAARPLQITVGSNGNPQFKGLSIEYKTTDVGCGGLFSSMSGTITSPNYPEKYLPHMHCVYQIYVSWSRTIKLTFDVFDLEVTPAKSCDYDRVEIYTTYHNETVHGELLGKFCGAMLPPAIFSNTNSMVVVFVSDRSVSGPGWTAKFEAISRKTTCDYTMTAPSGNMVFDPQVLKFDKCTYHIAVHENQRILLKMNNMSLPCDKSSLTFRNGPSETSPPFASLPPESEVCTPKVNYLPVIRSFSNRVTIIFKSINSEGSYFNLTYETIASGCGGRVDGFTGVVSAPQYPLGDKKNLKCEWTVAVALGNKVRFALTAIDDLNSADSAGFCPVFSPNRLDFYNSVRRGQLHLKRYCAKEMASEPITSDDNELTLRYVQAGGFQSKKIFGFSGHFTTLCTGIVLNSISGNIQSPGYPYRVYVNQFCSWTIRVPKGNRILVTVHHFSISQKSYYSGIICQTDMLKVDDTDLAEAEVTFKKTEYNTTNTVNRYCDKAIPRKIRSKHNTMKLTYMSSQDPTNQFWLSWSTVGCSRDINLPQQLIISKEQIDAEIDEFECQYKIEAPVGKQINLIIEKLDILPIESECSYKKDAHFNGFAIFMGSSNASAVPFQTYCTQISQQNISSHTNELFLFLSMNKDRLKSNVFFNATIEFVDIPESSPSDSCGRIINLERGVKNSILSPGFPALYPVGVVCKWLINAPPGYHIEYTVEEYHTPNYHEERTVKQRTVNPFSSSNVSCQWQLPYSDGMLSFYIGNRSTTTPFEKVCEETTTPRVLEMYATQSLVIFEGASSIMGQKSGEGSRERNGMWLSIRPRCGGVVYAESKPQTVSLLYENDEEVCNITIKKKDPEDSDIYIRLEEYTKINASSQHTIDDRIDIYSGEELKHTVMLKATDNTMQEYTSDEEMKISVRHGNAPHSAILVVSTDEKNCGGEVRHSQGTIYAPERQLDKPFDCGWTISNNIGNTVTLSVLDHNLVYTPNCTDSYIEVRADNSSGKLLKRQCDVSTIDSTEFEAQSLYVFLRYRPSPSDSSDDDDDDVQDPDQQDSSKRPLFKARYEKVSGGRPKNRYVANPVIDDVEMMVWTLDVVDESAGILVKFGQLYLSSTSYLRFSEADEIGDMANVGFEEVSGFVIPAEKFFETNLIRVYGKIAKADRFVFTWDPVPLNYKNMTVEKNKKKVYDCGGYLTATYDWDSFTNPLPAGQSFGYEENLHCRWTITRPMFTGIELKFEYLDLEDVENCAYDFVSFKLQFDDQPDDDDAEVYAATKHCALASSNMTFHYSVNRALHIHFVTDKSRHGVGFKLNYRLTCSGFEHIRPGAFFEHTLQSPNFDGKVAQRDWDCQFTLILESNRPITVEIVELDIEEKSPCATDNVLILANKFIELISTYNQYDKASKFCGKLEPGERVNFTSTRGRLFMKYFAKSSSRKGFKLIMREKMAECPSGILNLDENTPSRVLQSPEFPQRIPNSVECEYVMAAPNGHRVMLTFDADQFDISGDPKNCETLDYVQIRNGPSEHSELIGTFCGNQPPSTIFSTSNFLYMKLHTSEYGRSRRFIAKYEIATCGGTIIVRENYTSHILSPNFPDPYNTPVQCEWNVRSPNTHMIEAKVDHLWIFYNQNCTMEQLTIRDGDSNSKPLIGPACVALRIPNSYTRSVSNQLTVQFTSNASVSRGGRQYCSQKKCGFDVAVKLSEEKCGGIITNAMGTLKPPGYPGRLLPHVKCVWDFKAKPGMVFMFKLNFLREDSYRKIEKYTMAPTKQLCFPDLSIVEGFPPYDGAQFSQSFCKNQSQITSSTDITRLVYDDSFTREAISVLANDALQNVSFYAPFSIDYMVIPATKDNRGCTYHVTSNISMDFHPALKANKTVVRVDSFCHIAIEKPLNTASVYIKIDNYGVVSQQDTKDISTCHSWGAHIRIQSNEPTPIQKVVCEASAKLTNRTEMIYINPKIDILIIQIFREQEAQDFSLTVEFHSCGGAITTPNSGEITSPNNGYTYLSNSKCRWVLEAPEGQIVKVKIVEMRIEYDHECKNDRLLIGEGRQAELNTIHTYCHILDGDAEQKLEDRLRTIRSRGRFMTLQWETDSKLELSGWKLQYEFVNENEDCGFHTRGMSGVIHTPKFGENDYENDLECVWDVQVPIGYHVSLKYRDFDVEASENCEKDKLVISQEHSTRANSPNGEYYFFFQDEEKETPLCGIEHPKDFESESNRLRLNFTTDSKTTARGFRIDWEAKCGTIYRLNNGVITSPHYPEGYPNEAVTCTYLIAPMDQNSVIAIKFSDFDLSNLKTSYGRTPCESDYLQIIETSSERVLYNLCGGDKMPEDALVIKGPVGLVFVTSVDWTVVNALTLEKAKKNYKGFQLAYSINKCGDSIALHEGNRLSTSIRSPAFPLPYTKNLDCVWNITTDSNRQLSVRFEKLSLESFTDCTADFVELYDSSDMIFNKTLGKFCGSMKNIPLYRLVTTGPYLLVHMKTDFTVNGGGFKLIVTATLGEKDGCSGKLTATNEWKTLSSPQDEDGNYPPNLMCGWTISGPINSQLRIRIDGVDTEKLEYPPGVRPKPECIDALSIYDGQEFVSPILAGDICTSRTPIPKLLYTSHRHAFVTFETDQDGTGKGFNLSYSVVQNECGGWLQATTETKTLIYKGISLEENRGMNKERSHQRCRFMIQATVTDPVVIYFKQFNIPSKAGDCSDSYLEIRDVGSLQECKHPACAREPGQRKTTKLCGSHVPYSHISVTNTIQMIVSAEIVTAANNSRPMFKIEYNLLDNCNRTIDTGTVQSGRITSQNFPNPYSENSTCTTQLQTSNKKLLIVFNEFMLEDRESGTKGCDYDSLLIKEDDGTNGTYYCGQTLPASFLTSGKDLVTILKSDHSVNHGGYDASYFTVVSERDDQIQFANSYELEGVISNIGYPNGYNMSFTQIFKLMPPGSHDCSIIFSDLNIGLSQNEEECTQPTEEYLEFEFRIKDQVKKARIRDCTLSNKNTRELILEADSNDRSITFTFKSDGKSENDGRGFKIRWKCIGRTNENVPNDSSNF